MYLLLPDLCTCIYCYLFYIIIIRYHCGLPGPGPQEKEVILQTLQQQVAIALITTNPISGL